MERVAYNRTKIVATVGPASNSKEMLTALVHPHQNDADRQAIIADMGPVLKGNLANLIHRAAQFSERTGLLIHLFAAPCKRH